MMRQRSPQTTDYTTIAAVEVVKVELVGGVRVEGAGMGEASAVNGLIRKV